jgi:hypothetical protein
MLSLMRVGLGGRPWLIDTQPDKVCHSHQPPFVKISNLNYRPPMVQKTRVDGICSIDPASSFLSDYF